MDHTIFNLNFSISNWENNDNFSKIYDFASRISQPVIITIIDGYPLEKLSLFRQIIKKENPNIKFKFMVQNRYLSDYEKDFLKTYAPSIYQIEIPYNEKDGSSILGTIKRAITIEKLALNVKIFSYAMPDNYEFLINMQKNCKSAKIVYEIKYLTKDNLKQDQIEKYYKDMMFFGDNCKKMGCDACMANAINIYFDENANISPCKYSKATQSAVNDEVVLDPHSYSLHTRAQKKQNYYVQFPISLDCNLRCEYCFNRSYYENNYDAKPKDKISVEQFLDFKKRILFDRKNIVITPHGGEPFFDNNLLEVLNLLEKNQDCRFEFLTNGIQNRYNYEQIVKYKDLIDRIGFTYHRAMIDKSKTLKEKFKSNILFLKNLGIKVYIKELLILEYKEDIVKSQKYWKDNYDIDVFIQDLRNVEFRGNKYHDCYGHDEYALISDEYKHPEEPCRCKADHHTIIIKDDGSILPCWHSQQEIGNVKKLLFQDYKY